MGSLVELDPILDFAASILGYRVRSADASKIVGGDINDCYRVGQRDNNVIFIKANTCSGLLRAEFDSLCAIAAYGISAYPDVLGFKETEDGAYLALEYLQLQPVTEQTGALAAKLLLDQHKINNGKFGWHQDGYIGYSKQANQWQQNWADFFTQCRLAPQLELAIGNGLNSNLVQFVERLIKDFDQYIDVSSIRPALLHGDLWGGNLGFDTHAGGPVFYDPAPYFGDPEVDIAMTRLFGSLPNSFYRAYRIKHYEPCDLHNRESLYNLYHSLNHFNLFGNSYEALISSLCGRVQ